MPKGDGSEKECFDMWKSGLGISEIERRTTAKPTSVRAWIRNWERGAQREWNANLPE